ncbi:MAG: omptin family outer membrane protease [Paracoccus sp. (in: a-proteobacteria)]|nr:omptin family outer membrane protease [Paracoccus sp. (in: a-proteobacteria)]
MCRSLFVTAFSATALFAVSAQAFDWPQAETAAAPEFTVGLGYLDTRANERVYDAAGNQISRLIWSSDAQVLNLGVRTQTESGMTVRGRAQIGLGGNSDMVDYDWSFWSDGFGADQWSDRSIHPDTRLERYIDMDVALGRDYQMESGARVNLHGGFTWTSVKWSARGGSYVYSEWGFRDEEGDFPDGVRGITYAQSLPTLYAGASVTQTYGAWTLNGALRGGFAVNAQSTDNHWQRDLRFEERAGVMPYIGAALRGDYALNDVSAIYVGVEYAQHFNTKTDVTVYDEPTGARLVRVNDGGGMDLRRIGVEAGAVLRF